MFFTRSHGIIMHYVISEYLLRMLLTLISAVVTEAVYIINVSDKHFVMNYN